MNKKHNEKYDTKSNFQIWFEKQLDQLLILPLSDIVFEYIIPEHCLILNLYNNKIFDTRKKNDLQIFYDSLVTF